jgi:hypothetical protein
VASLKNNQHSKRGGKRPGAGRKTGVRNKRTDLQTFLTAVSSKVDLVAVTVRLLNSKRPNERVLIRILEYLHGRPAQELSGPDGGPIPVQVIDTAGLRSRA